MFVCVGVWVGVFGVCVLVFMWARVGVSVVAGGVYVFRIAAVRCCQIRLILDSSSCDCVGVVWVAASAL